MTTIVTKNGSGAPLASDLVQGELAVDLTNKRLYTENASGTVIEVGTNPSTLTVTGDLAVDTDTLFADASEDKVAINDATGRNSTLHINSATLSASIGLSASGTTTKDNQALVCSGDDLFFTTGATERMRIDSSGNVGIGTSDPSSFSIDTGPDIILGDGTDNPHLSIVSPTTGTGYVAFADGTAGTAKYSGLIEYAHSTDHMGLRTGATERMRIDSSGNVLVGTTSAGTLAASGRGLIALNGASDSLLDFRAGGSTYGYLYNSASEFRVANHTANPVTFFTSNTERMRIDSSGNVGIGTTSVTSGFKMEVLGDVRVGDAVGDDAVEMGWSAGSSQGFIQAYDRGASAFRALNLNNAVTITSSGNVGIGTSSPVSKVHVLDEIRISSTSNSAGTLSLGDGGSGNDNVGIWRGAANSISDGNALNLGAWGTLGGITFSVGDAVFGSKTERMRIDGSGNVGIGTSSPATLLDVSSATSNTTMNVTNNDGLFQIQKNSDDVYLNLEDTGDFIFRLGDPVVERMRIDASGNVGIGTTSPLGSATERTVHIASSATTDYATVYVTNSNNSVKGVFSSDGTLGQITLGAQSNHPVLFSTNNTERMRIDSSGALMVGKTSSSIQPEGVLIYGNGEIYSTIASNESYVLYDTTNNLYRFRVSSAGQISATNTSISAISDASLKENIRDLDKGLDTINALQPRRFDWKNGDGNDIMGFIAQEVEEVMPELIDETQYNKDEIKKSLKMGDMIPSMVKAIQELSAQVDELKAEVAALKGA